MRGKHDSVKVTAVFPINALREVRKRAETRGDRLNGHIVRTICHGLGIAVTEGQINPPMGRPRKTLFSDPPRAQHPKTPKKA